MRKPKKKAGTKLLPTDGMGNTMGDDAKRAKAYFAMEPYVCDLARAAQVAMILHDDDTGLLLFAIDQFNKLAEDLRKRWYAMEFPPN
jgi:hypothetical protein